MWQVWSDPKMTLGEFFEQAGGVHGGSPLVMHVSMAEKKTVCWGADDE